MIIDITNEILTELDELLEDVEVLTSYPNTYYGGTVVTFEEIYNITDKNTISSGGVQMNIVALEVNIYSSGVNKMIDCKETRDKIDTLLSGKYKMNRDDSKPTPNQFGNDIYKYTMRYSFVIDKNKKIYRR